MELITQCTLSEFKDNWGELQQKLLPHFKELEGGQRECRHARLVYYLHKCIFYSIIALTKLEMSKVDYMHNCDSPQDRIKGNILCMPKLHTRI